MNLTTHMNNGMAAGAAANSMAFHFESTPQATPSGFFSLTKTEVAVQTKDFVDALRTSKDHGLKPLHEILSVMVKEKNELIKQALIKPKGFVSRLFSSESWNEWTQDKTALGRVAGLFSDCLNGTVGTARIKGKLSDEVILKANLEAAKVLQELGANEQTNAKLQADRPAVSSHSDCPTALAFGAAVSAISHSPLPLGLASLECLPRAAARETIYQGEAVIQPGKSMYFEAGRKIAICKNGVSAWNSHHSCSHRGPNMRVTVMRDASILVDGPYGGSGQWFCGVSCNKLSLLVENNSNEESTMYVHTENH